ncbi:MAG TPA: diacylglycerol kinase family protein [Ktedonobacteraceae bacterium]
MKRKQASLVINPRTGQNLAQITDVLAVFAAAGWSTDLALKVFGGHSMALAQKATEDGQDLVIAYGGDGTLNQVVNGVMHANKKQQPVVGLVPGGTANVWASEIGVPTEPVKAALALVDSDVRKVDVGHIGVSGLTFADPAQNEQLQSGKKSRQAPVKDAAKVRQHFLLMAGLGFDAAVMERVSQPLKYRVGALAVGVSSLKELPAHHPFPVEICTGDIEGNDILWKGEALQVVIGNTRLYADIVEMTPDARMDDGILDVCVITAGNPLSTMQQVFSLLLHRHPDNLTSESFRGAHLTLRVPASVALQLDGSAMKLKDYLSKSDQQTLAHAANSEQLMVTYQFDAIPHALQMAIPRTYSGDLFEKSDNAEDEQKESASDQQNQGAEQTAAQQEQQPERSQQERKEDLEHIKTLVAQGRSVTVVGVKPNPAEKGMYIVAGTITKQSTGEIRPVAVRVDAHTVAQKKTGEPFALEELCSLRTGATIVVAGDKSKRGVIEATQIVI